MTVTGELWTTIDPAGNVFDVEITKLVVVAAPLAVTFALTTALVPVTDVAAVVTVVGGAAGVTKVDVVP